MAVMDWINKWQLELSFVLFFLLFVAILVGIFFLEVQSLKY